MHGPTCIVWANLTPFSLKTAGDVGEDAGAPWGALFLLLALPLAAFYTVGGVMLRYRAGKPGHPHAAQWAELAGLVRDGIGFARAGGRRRRPEVEGRAALLPER
jgi:hypothetical protein